MNTKAICMMTLFYYQDLKAVTGLYWMRLVFSIVSLFPRENINLNKKAFWQSILVLVVKLRHRVNDLFSSKLVHEFKLMSSSMDNVEGSQKFIWKMQLQVRVSAIISLLFQGAPLSICERTVLGLHCWERFERGRKKEIKKREKRKSCWIFPSVITAITKSTGKNEKCTCNAKMKNARAKRVNTVFHV